MSILEIYKYPHPVLKKTCESVAPHEFTPEFQSLIDNMFETMYADTGMGLAANQIGVLKRIFIMDEESALKRPLVFVNPEILYESDEKTFDQEGCLSFPGIYLKIERPKHIRMKALDRHGREFTLEGSDYVARCMHHEFDHLRGIHFFDHLSALKRELAEKKLKKYMHSIL